jgi:1,6-anhydro-N-acetylmuramate kinase
MVDVLLLNRLRALAEHRRWLLGIVAGRRYRALRAALLAVEGSGLTSRVEVIAHREARLPRELSRQYRRWRQGRQASAAAGALLAARLAECQAALLDEFAADVAPVWQRLSAVAVDGPGVWRSARGLSGYADVCDAARLADLTGLNVIDGFPLRDVAQDGRGRPLAPLPLWMLLHDSRATRVYVEVSRRARLTYLPASRDATGAARTFVVRVGPPDQRPAESTLAQRIAHTMRDALPRQPQIGELVLADAAEHGELADRLRREMPEMQVLRVESLGVASAAVRPAVVAVLGLLHLDQVAANLPALSGARMPRVLGRLTPGSVVNWHCLLRELAARRPSVVTLRSAV